ncbi:hypothetical protein FVER14953_06975 [Fusarium verticillioides]|nr:hypothetical protein FVER14953_06975 [Fusarium verticillioides]
MTVPLDILIGSMYDSIHPAVATVTKVARPEADILLPENSLGEESRHELSRQQDLVPSRTDKPLERARLDDGHRERDVRRDNDRFKQNLEEDLRRLRELKERREDRRPDDYKYVDREPRWSDQRAREFMSHREPRYSRQHHEDREAFRGYSGRRN